MNVAGGASWTPRAVLWFIAGVIVALAATRIAIAPAANPGAPPPVLVRSSCASGVTLYERDGTTQRFVTLNEPGLYRLSATGTDARVQIGTLTDLRSLRELPLGTLGELVLPRSWCHRSDVSGGTGGIGLLGP